MLSLDILNQKLTPYRFLILLFVFVLLWWRFSKKPKTSVVSNQMWGVKF